MCDCKSEDRNFENEEISVIPDSDDLGYCQRCGGKFNSKVICEVCGDTEEWAWHTPRNKNKIKCANCGNENYINEPSKNPVKVASKPAPKPVSRPEEEPKKYVSDDFDDDYEEYGKTKLNTTLWIILGVLSSLFCCLIGGIITTVFAVKADRFQKEGKFYPASTALEKAEGWFAFTMIIWVIEIVIGIIAAIIF